MQLLDFKDRERGRSALIMGGGPSLLDINKDDYRGAVKIACNDYYRSSFYEDFKPGYWCAACSDLTLMGDMDHGGEQILDQAIEQGLILLIGIPRENERERSKAYIQGRGYTDKACYWDWKGFELQLALRLRYGTEGFYSHGTSVIVHQIALAFLMGCNPIHVTGMDLSYKAAKERTGQTHAGFNEPGLAIDDMLQVPSTLQSIYGDLMYFGQIAKRAGIDFRNLSWQTNNINFEGFQNG